MPAATRRILLVALFGGVLFDVLVVGNALGVNAPIVMAAFLVAAFLLAGLDGVRRMDPADAWLAPAALVLSALAVLRADDWLVAGFGKGFVDYFIRIKQGELARYNAEVSEWEQREYFELF